jgi:hypothetical protein
MSAASGLPWYATAATLAFLTVVPRGSSVYLMEHAGNESQKFLQ